LQLDLGVTSGTQLNETLDLSRLAQKMNIKNVWVGEDVTGMHEVFTLVSLMLLKNKNINTGIGITSPFIRNISTIARASTTLAQIGGAQRFRLGLGIGGLHDLNRLGIVLRNPVGMMREATTLLKRIWHHETITFESERVKLDHYRSSIKGDYQIPIVFGVRGPRLLTLAGEIADGVILSGPKTYLKKAASTVRNSIARSGRSAKNFTFVVWVPMMVAQKPSDLRFIRQTAAYVLLDTPQNVLEMAELDSARVETLKKTYQRHGIASAAKLINDALLDELAVHGNVKQVCEGFQALQKMHVHEVVFGPPYGAKPQAALAKIANAWRNHL